jgi:hypothetical protein
VPQHLTPVTFEWYNSRPSSRKTFFRRPSLWLPTADNTRRRLAQDKTRRDFLTEIWIYGSPAVVNARPQDSSLPFLQRSKPTAPRPRHTRDNLKIPPPLLLKPCNRDSRIFYQWATSSSAGTLFLPPRCSKLLEKSRRFYPGLARQIAWSSFPSASY